MQGRTVQLSEQGSTTARGPHPRALHQPAKEVYFHFLLKSFLYAQNRLLVLGKTALSTSAAPAPHSPICRRWGTGDPRTAVRHQQCALAPPRSLPGSAHVGGGISRPGERLAPTRKLC